MTQRWPRRADLRRQTHLGHVPPYTPSRPRTTPVRHRWPRSSSHNPPKGPRSGASSGFTLEAAAAEAVLVLTTEPGAGVGRDLHFRTPASGYGGSAGEIAAARLAHRGIFPAKRDVAEHAPQR